LSQLALRAALRSGATVVTATRRLARTLKAEYARGTDAASWPTPDVLPWPAWLRASYLELRDFGLLSEPRPCLDDTQAAALWEAVLAEDPTAGALLMPASAAQGCQEAWSLLHEWRLPWAALEQRAGEDCRVFLRVAAVYRRRLAELGSIDSTALPAIVAGTLAGQPGPAVLFAGFDGLTPAQQGIVAALGARARVTDVLPPRAQPSLAALPDSRTELAAAASWARSLLDAQPGARLAIVVPELETFAPLAEDLLDEALAPQRLLAGHMASPRPWNMSLGAPLADAPVVAAALRALGLGQGALSIADVGRILRAPFFGGADSEAAERSRHEAWLRQHAGDRIQPAHWLGWLEGRRGAPACPRLAIGLRGLLDELRAGGGHQRPSAWAAAWTRALARLGWPGERPVDAATWQATEAWRDLLEAYARLDAVLPALSRREAPARLRRFAAEQRFQPEMPDVPVQVLGLLETAGLEFDALWVSGLHDGILPAPLRPCPLLPPGLQREHGLPRACTDRELALAQRLVARLTGAAPTLCFSYPQGREDEPLRPSPLIAALPALSAPPAPPWNIAAAGFAVRHTVAIDDMHAPPVSGDVTGGAGLLAAQSACPFMAFAVHRLGAEALETAAAGVDPRSRGQFVHEALRLVWAELHDRAGLHAQDAGARAATIEAALAEAARELPAELPAGLVQIELAEAARRIAELLEVEATRAPFEVLECELPVGVRLGPLQLRGRIDRLDRVTGGLVVIDYKTGAASPADWAGERPAEPQMLLYALAHRDELAGLAYASLRPGGVGLRGRANGSAVFGDALGSRELVAAEEWPALLESWQATLTRLAEEFAAGDARVAPRQPHGQAGTCARCHLATLCRRDELLRAGTLPDG
jgi:ATP-dependent helicase/nuclease subunit B